MPTFKFLKPIRKHEVKSLHSRFYILLLLLIMQMRMPILATHNGRIELHIEYPGQLVKLIGEHLKYKVTSLKLTGVVGSSDVALIRDMAGCDVDGKATNGKLAYVDLREAQLVADGGLYYRKKSVCYMVNNVVGNCMFRDCKSLKRLYLPDTICKIGAEAFSGCSALEEINVPNAVKSVGDLAFNGCIRLRHLRIPASVKQIGGGAFLGMGTVSTCNLISESEYPPIAQYVLFSSDNHIILQVPQSAYEMYVISNWGEAQQILGDNE